MPASRAHRETPATTMPATSVLFRAGACAANSRIQGDNINQMPSTRLAASCQTIGTWAAARPAATIKRTTPITHEFHETSRRVGANPNTIGEIKIQTPSKIVTPSGHSLLSIILPSRRFTVKSRAPRILHLPHYAVLRQRSAAQQYCE